MTTDIKELVKLLRATVYLGEAGTHYVNQDGPAAADALEAMEINRDLWRDKCVLVEAERDRLKAAITTHVAGCVACGGSGVVFLCPERDDTAEAVREDCEECVGLRKALGGEE